MSQNEEHSTQNHDWDDADPGIKQRFQELAKGDTEHRTKSYESPEKAIYPATQPPMSPEKAIYQAIQDSLEPEPSLYDELCAMSDLLSQEEDYTND